MATRPIEFSADGRELYWLDSRGRDTVAVVAQDLESGAMRVLAEDPRADFTQLVLDPISGARLPPRARSNASRGRSWTRTIGTISTISRSDRAAI